MEYTSHFSDEERLHIRERLKEVAGYNSKSHKKKLERAQSEFRHKKEVPYEGVVHFSVGNGRTSLEIDRAYNKSMPNILFLFLNLLVSKLRKLIVRVRVSH